MICTPSSRCRFPYVLESGTNRLITYNSAYEDISIKLNKVRWPFSPFCIFLHRFVSICRRILRLAASYDLIYSHPVSTCVLPTLLLDSATSLTRKTWTNFCAIYSRMKTFFCKKFTLMWRQIMFLPSVRVIVRRSRARQSRRPLRSRTPRFSPPPQNWRLAIDSRRIRTAQDSAKSRTKKTHRATQVPIRRRAFGRRMSTARRFSPSRRRCRASAVARKTRRPPA